MQCSFCSIDQDLPFTCSYCKMVLCSSHRLPEKHNCIQLHMVHSHRDIEYLNPQRISNTRSFDSKINQLLSSESRHLLLGMILVLLVGISFFFVNFGGSYPVWTVLVLSIILMGSFLIHEMSHKFIALKNGFNAEFRVNSFGLFLTFLSIFPIPFKIIAPGAVVISGSPSKKILGQIALSGPFSNIVLGFISILILSWSSLSSEWQSILSTAAFINGFLATFNLLPFSIIDGKKVFDWNKIIWFVFFFISISFILIVSYSI